jgi:hypothetical protein
MQRLWIPILVGLILLFSLQAVWAEPPGGDLVRRHPRGQGTCFTRAVVLAYVIIRPGCYTFYVLRTPSGAFLAFGPPGPHLIPPGQLVRLSTPAGAKVRGRLFYLVPVPVTAVGIPVDTVQVMAVQVVVTAGRVVFLTPRGARLIQGPEGQRN